MKFRFTDVSVENVGGSYEGTSASFEITDSDGNGLIVRDSASFVPSEGTNPTYASLAAVSALTQTQIYNDFKPSEVVDSEGTTVGELLETELRSNIEIELKVAQQEATPTIEFVDNITDQTPINI